MAISGYLGAQYNLLIAETGGQVLDYLQNQPVEVLIISMSLDGLDAVSTIHTIRKSYLKLPVILLSNLINLNTLRLAAEEELNEILQIPVQSDSMLEILQKYLPEHTKTL